MNTIREIKRRIDEVAPFDFEEFCNTLLVSMGMVMFVDMV